MTAPVAIGALRHRLTVEEPVATTDDLGGAAIVYVVVGDVWAAVAEPALAERIGADERAVGVATHRLVLRDDITVAVGWRLTGGGRSFRVLAITSAGPGFVRCLAEAVAP